MSMKTGAVGGGGSHLYIQHKQNLEFKYLYFKIQKLINKKVNLSLKYEQLKSPEIHSTLIKPITDTIIKTADAKSLLYKLKTYDIYKYGEEQTVSDKVVFILLLLRYEYLIQSENNLISHELLITKANLCELLAIRMLREYKSYNRINLLFINPLRTQTFNTLELAVLSNSKRFLTQPIIVRILDRFYNGELIRDSLYNMENDDDERSLIGNNVKHNKLAKLTFKNIVSRCRYVPKYQSLVINLRLVAFMMMYFLLILSKRGSQFSKYSLSGIETAFWLIGMQLNLEFLLKISKIEVRFFRMIIWNHIDFILICLVDLSFLLKITYLPYYRDVFSLISIIILPRMLSVLNNYRFFNLIIVSFNRMMWNLMGLLCFFTSLISGFFFAFITLSKDRSNYDIMFDMVKIFFGFTPSVWNNWDNYNPLGKTIQMAYLFLIQFFIGTVMAIVLSRVFAKVNEQNQQEFDYFKATNLILYFKMAEINSENSAIMKLLNLANFPTNVLIMTYEMLIGRFFVPTQDTTNELKFYTFLSRNDYDQELVDMLSEDADGESLLVQKSRNTSLLKQPYGRRYSQIKATPALNQVQSISTLGGNFRSASTDSNFIDEILNKKYGKKSIPLEKVKTNNSDMRLLSTPNNRAFFKPKSMKTRSKEILTKLINLEEMLFKQQKDQQNDELTDDDNESNTDEGNEMGIYDIAEAALNDIDLINSDLDYAEYENSHKPQLIVDNTDNDMDTLSEAVYELDDTF